VRTSAPSPIVLVTGGASGIGWATVQEFAQEGWTVVIGDIDICSARERAGTFAEGVFAMELDVRCQKSVEQVMNSVERQFGRLDALINNAGIQRWTSLTELDWGAWASVLDVNLNGVVRCLNQACHLMEDSGGAIVNVVSIAAKRGVPMRAPYTASKAAVVGLTRTAAVELAPKGIRVNAVGPGYVSTELIETFVASGQLQREPILNQIPMGRFAAPREIATVIRFLASADASYITGQVIFADGGYLANSGISPGAARTDA
jgi:3-oxoacyl-[acyl-carrier protein] reductase